LVTFENRLPEESIVHWHGLVVPQDQDGQPGDAVPAGASYEYDFVIENDPGTYWYHPHPHTRTGEQVYRGLAGLLIVHGDEPPLPSGENDIALVLQDRTIGSDGQLRYVAGMHDQMAGFVGNTLVTNGVTELTIGVKREPYRIRLLNGANSRTQYLTWSSGDPLSAIATDGYLLPEAVDVDGLVITPAQRTDLWVDFSGFEPGQRIDLLSADTFIESGAMMGQGMGNRGGASELNLDPQVAATFVVAESEPAPGVIPSPLGTAPTFGPGDAVNASSPKQFTLSTRRATHWINGAQWEGRNVSEIETAAANTVELWEFVSNSPMPHPIHLHGKSFLVVDRSWDDDSAAAALATIEHGIIETGLRDTVLVWPGQRVRIAIPFADHRGYFPYHCHILEHEDAGMMRNFLVT
jgi:FtsP/CotA-like multicopper oxidase with cupredoxin domain